jgi:cell division protein FtsB
MRRYTPLILFLAALCLGVLLFIGDDSYSHLRTLEQNLRVERKKNDELQHHVDEVKQKIHGLRKDDRYLERTVRNELGLAKPDELVFIFDDARARSSEKEVPR